MTESSQLYSFITTADGSPSVRILERGPALGGALDTTSSGEAMHSLKGAFSETVYIYGTAIDHAMKLPSPLAVLSMGLGLGYVELLAAGLALKAGRENELRIESFEILKELRSWFVGWLQGSNGVRPKVPPEVPSDVPLGFATSYAQILELTARETGVSAESIRGLLLRMQESGRWQVRAALTSKTVFDHKFSCICFDAFSSKSSPELWSEDFLRDFLAKSASEHAVLSTYACTGKLKRALVEAGFTLQIRLGFASKRDSTFASR